MSSSSSNAPNRPALVGSVLAVLGAVGVAIVGALSPACAPTCDLVGCMSRAKFTLPSDVDGAFVATIRGQVTTGEVAEIAVECPAEGTAFHETGFVFQGSPVTVVCRNESTGRSVNWEVPGDRGGTEIGQLLERATVEVVMASPGFAGGTARYGAEVDAIDYGTFQPNGPECAPTCFSAEIALGPLP